ncbi:MAG: aspartate-semialdehyde dehydrogenase [Chloroflexi bacterium]|nr:aspartate-semialdehyde dehydrogenase [Chloroflexota bacterium]MBU1750241.1 aspartate-semialdehyde dehydrogenase [Chloroflexota bacterium]MBU1878946.1 aspartate-semialdehyde dehydrogenase [Chloroflexota bacterium]
MNRIPVGILGATGTVGQRFVQLLDDHPWFQVTALAASDRSVGQRYADACHWLLPTPIPDAARDLVVQPIEPGLECRVVFSALPSGVAGPVEERFARAGHAVCSNAAAHRMDADVPLLIPEVNPDHTALIGEQRRRRGWQGLVVTSANCSTTQLALALKPLHDAFGLRRLSVVTMQAASGAGYPGVPALDLLDNLVPYIGGEEEKVEQEPLKLLGTLEGDRVASAAFVVSAQCNRVPVRDGHTECVSIEFARQPGADEVIAALEGFRGPAEAADLPGSPAHPIVVRREPDRPQPVRDRDAGRGMSVVVGRVRPCPVLHTRFVLLGHNTVRGAAGGSIHNAELLVAQGWVA